MNIISHSTTKNEMDKKKWKYIISIFLLSLLLFIVITPLRGGYFKIGNLFNGPQLSMIIGFVLHYLYTYFVLKFTDGKVNISATCILISIFLGKSILEIPLRIIDFEDTLTSLLDSLTHILGILSGFICYKIQKNQLKVLFSALCLTFTFWLSTSGYEMWLNYRNFSSLTGRLKEKSIYALNFQAQNGESLQLKDYTGKYLILDLWHTRCGTCYRKMPKVQELYDEHKGSKDIVVKMLHCRVKEKNESTDTGSRILIERNFTMPCMSIDIKDPILKNLGVRVYPTVLIFDKESQLIFRGSIEGAIEIINKLTESEKQK